jgi:DNA-binding transcriptional LysR family regulator
MDRFQELRGFVAVVDAGSFVGAADRLGLSKAALSRQIAELEARLGVRLLHRTTRRLSLTPEGERFLLRARELLAQLEEAEAEVGAGGREISGRLRINAPVSFGLQRLAPLWGEFLRQYPRVALEISLADRSVDLVEEGFDLAIRIARLESSSLVSRRLASTRMVLCASPGYLRTAEAPRVPADLVAHRVIAYSYWSARDEWRFTGPEGEIAVRTRPQLRCNNGETCLALALADQGLVLQPQFIVGEALRAGRLVELLPEWRVGELGIYAVYASRRHLPPKLRAMIDFLVATLREPEIPA